MTRQVCLHRYRERGSKGRGRRVGGISGSRGIRAFESIYRLCLLKRLDNVPTRLLIRIHIPLLGARPLRPRLSAP